MGEILKNLSVRTKPKIELGLMLFFDSGSPYTIAKKSTAEHLEGLMKLIQPREFSGLGNGAFTANYGLDFQVKLLDIWCLHFCYVVEDEILEENEDILIGHDFIQKFKIGLDFDKEDLILDRNALKRAQKIRFIKE